MTKFSAVFRTTQGVTYANDYEYDPSRYFDAMTYLREEVLVTDFIKISDRVMINKAHLVSVVLEENVCQK